MHSYFFMDDDFSGSHPVLSVCLHVLVEKEEGLVRQKFSFMKSLYTTVWVAGKPETSLKLGTKKGSCQPMEHKTVLACGSTRSRPVCMLKVSACRKELGFCATPLSCGGCRGAGWTLIQSNSDLLLWRACGRRVSVSLRRKGGSHEQEHTRM